MSKIIVTILFAFISTASLAQRDSVAFFYTPKKINVLINEKGEVSRLHDFMNFFKVGNELILKSEDKDIKLECAREFDRATCTFTFYPSSNVQTDNRELHVEKELTNFGVVTSDAFEMSFRGSMKDNIHLVIDNGILLISASKK